VALQESEAFLEGALVIIHIRKMKEASIRARRYDDSATRGQADRFRG
jgi:hypothetical protein